MYKEDKELRRKVKLLAALAILHSDLVLPYFEVLSYDIPAELEPPYDYFEDNYLRRPARQGQRRAPNFTIKMRSIYHWPEFGILRTNNAVEGWQRAFNVR